MKVYSASNDTVTITKVTCTSAKGVRPASSNLLQLTLLGWDFCPRLTSLWLEDVVPWILAKWHLLLVFEVETTPKDDLDKIVDGHDQRDKRWVEGTIWASSVTSSLNQMYSA